MSLLTIDIINFDSNSDYRELLNQLTSNDLIENASIDSRNKSIAVESKKLFKVKEFIFKTLDENNIKYESKTETFPILNMTCASCASSSQSFLRRQEGVITADVNYASTSGTIKYIPAITDPETLKEQYFRSCYLRYSIICNRNVLYGLGMGKFHNVDFSNVYLIYFRTKILCKRSSTI